MASSSESEEKKLAGLARSIDSLFSSADPSPSMVSSDASPEVEGGPETAEEEPEALDGEPDTSEEVPGEPVLEVEGGEEGVATREASVSSAVGAQPIQVDETPEAETHPEILDTDATGPGSESAFQSVVATSAEESAQPDLPTEDEEPAEPYGAHEGAPKASASDRKRAVVGEPGPLLAAVEAFLAGDGDAAAVRALAEAHLRGRELDPVAAAVELLVLDAGEPPHPEAMTLAKELLDPLVRSRMVRRLGDQRDAEVRESYYEICTRLGEEMAAAIRDEMAEETDIHARRVYVDALVSMADVSRPIVESMVEDENRFLARNGVTILAQIGGPRAAELVVSALANTDPRVRREALLSMAKLEVEDAEPLVTGLLGDTDRSVRLAAVVAAGELRVERAVRLLVAMLDETNDDDVALSVLLALGQIGDPGAVPTIEKHAVRQRFGKRRTDVRIAAYQALSQIGTPHARRLLNRAMSDKDPAVSSAVKQLLHRLA